jgi:putative transposase
LADDVKRDFTVSEPGLRTCGDITHIVTGEGWLFLSGVLALGSQRCVGDGMDDRLPTALVARALVMAVELRDGDVKGMIFHADRGTQYMSREFRELCEKLGVLQSVGSIGSCHDNAVSESFWAKMKREMVSCCRFETRADARRPIIAWTYHYNELRQHSSINNMSPIEWELRFAQRQLQAA